jgi:hypothetical protein
MLTQRALVPRARRGTTAARWVAAAVLICVSGATGTAQAAGNAPATTTAAVTAHAIAGTAARAASGAQQPWQAYNLAPLSRTVRPAAVYATHGTVQNPADMLSGQPTRLAGQGSYIVLDFGKEVGGLVTLDFAGASTPGQSVGLAFSESSLSTGTSSDSSNGGPGADGAIYATVNGPGSYTMPAASLRGGFRYLTLFLDSAGWVDVTGAALQFTAAPDLANPRDYPDYFYSSDRLLNRIWYAGAYTVEMDTINPAQGRVWPPPASGWDNSGLVGTGNSVLVDGAKRDRTVWPGDLGISVPTDYVSLDDMASVRNALTTLYGHQNPVTGEMPYAGPEVNFGGSGAPVSSDTYHMWALIATADYYLYTGDRAWLDSVWPQYTKAVGYSTAHIGPRGLMFVTGTADWGRTGQGGENIEANVLLYRVLTTGAQLAEAESDAVLATRWTQAAGALKSAVNSILWDAPAGAYRDNPASSLHPQDGNALAIWFGLTASAAQNASILAYLRSDWNSYGAATPEWNGGDHPYPGSMEVMARFAAGDDAGALDLIRREWGYMLNSPIGTASTFWEGYNANGSFGYDSTGPGYTSLAHGWSTGPTAALTFDVLGVAPDGPGGSYHFIPHPGDLQFAQGRLGLPQGAITAAWDRGTGRFTEHLTAPAGTSGEAAVPTFGQQVTVTVNGTIAWDGTTAKSYGAHADSSYVYLNGLPAGSFTIIGSYANG